MTSWGVTVAAYSCVAAVAVAVEVLAHVRPGLVPPLGQVLTWAMRRRSTQLGLVFAWWWLGWHFATAR